jgi:hypothetical protein
MLEHSPSLLPRLPRGRPSAATKAAYQDGVAVFCTKILEIQSRLDFSVGSRGWAYILEGERYIDKDEIDAAQNLVNACRKSGDLPLDICAEDDKRAAENVEELDPGPEEMAAGGWADLNVRAGFMRRFAEKEAEGKRCVLLVFTDHDPGGLHINKFLRSNLEELTQAVGWSPDNLIIERFGLDYDFIEREQLTWIDNLATSKGEYPLDDEHHPDHNKDYVQDYLRKFGARKVEADALLKVPELGRELCRQAILKYVSATAPRRYHAKLKPVRAEMRRALDRLLRGRAP